jgi:molybdopterin-guanine dinucleotide biosynthesis protein A
VYNNISAAILAGGKSLRMGTEKSLLKLGDETIIGRVAKTLKSIFADVTVITNKVTEYQFLNLPVYTDIYKRKGVLSGIHCALVHSKTDSNFIISCDMPMVTRELICYIVEYASDKSIKYCFAANRHHYLAGVYHKSIIPKIEQIFLSNDKFIAEKEKKLALKNLLTIVAAEIILPENLPFYKPELFFNINTPEDYAHLIKCFA